MNVRFKQENGETTIFSNCKSVYHSGKNGKNRKQNNVLVEQLPERSFHFFNEHVCATL